MVHKFWDNQPIQRESNQIGYLTEIPHEEMLRLPEGYAWDRLNISVHLDELYLFLMEHYLENDVSQAVYSKELLKWILDQSQSWILAVRVEKTKKLVACITGVPIKLKLPMERVVIKTVEINFLCVHKKLRDKRLAPVLIGGIKRYIRDTSESIKCAIYTMPFEVAQCVTEYKYYHRIIDIGKFLEANDTLVGDQQLKRLQKKYIPSKVTKSTFVFKDCETAEDWQKVYTMYKLKYRCLEMYQEYTCFELSQRYKTRHGVVRTLMAYDLKSDCVGFVVYTYRSSIVKSTGKMLYYVCLHYLGHRMEHL